ncbi:Ger(x)C family spore germination protein [Pullulanibacillus sp. KACC 23026]|uniref:Ger(x)C family spore germination protein n=1 Tax=Pullulanibacillus sp. KACC 23026 TaxID=3028315 RepID=UPI0023B07722|nr:Ger(x)C family spore germination protein [Pullulanibacillus sp. KACC 23026]WEG13225.1 Ger(x)C family spore germination protein [Pullulanibacillus sp. KACC 23026]
MKKLRTWEILIGLLLVALSFMGGTVPKQIIDDVRLATAVGYDYKDPNNFVGTLEAPVFNPDLTLTQEVYSDVAPISKMNRREINAESPYVVVSGKLQAVLFNIPLAKQGIMSRIDTLNRDPSIGERIYLAIVDGSSKELLSKQYEQNLDDGTYLAELMEQNSEQSFLPTTNLHEFSVSYYTEGVDACLPLLKVVGNKIQIKGVAYFNNDKYKGFVNNNEAIYLKMLKQNFKSGSLMARKSGSKTMINMENIKSSRKFKVTYKNGLPHVTITITIRGIVTESYKSNGISNQEIEDIFEKKIKRVSRQLISRFKKEHSDPIEIGYQVRIRDRNWDYEKWKSEYKDVPVKVKAHVQIIEKGLKT